MHHDPPFGVDTGDAVTIELADPVVQPELVADSGAEGGRDAGVAGPAEQ
jgi:hypothetical protein